MHCIIYWADHPAACFLNHSTHLTRVQPKLKHSEESTTEGMQQLSLVSDTNGGHSGMGGREYAPWLLAWHPCMSAELHHHCRPLWWLPTPHEACHQACKSCTKYRLAAGKSEAASVLTGKQHMCILVMAARWGDVCIHRLHPYWYSKAANAAFAQWLLSVENIHVTLLCSA